MTTPGTSGPAAAAALRRQLGPTAWCMFECLRERSADDRVADASVRAIAADLGVAKNTAHRAIATLVRAGLIEAEQRRDRDGRFQAGRYVLHLHQLSAMPAPTTRAPRRSTPRVDVGQLSLLPGA
ncbi:MAG: helix-turn-helix domain-containing protein [Acidimicrobiales bacterium]